MDLSGLEVILSEVDVDQPSHMDIGGHKICAEIRALKKQFKKALKIILDDRYDNLRRKEDE